MNSLAFSSIKTVREKLEKKEISTKELLQYTLKRFEKYDKNLGAALEIFDEQSIIQASIAQGKLNGIPGLAKDNICQKDRITSCSSKILQNFRATYDATVIKKLKEEGALLVGRANCDEFAMGSSTETSAYQKTVNPWDFSRVPGGSSGGSIAAVAAGLVPWALGSETGGSVRQPAAFCGIVGSKPTYGLVSRYGLVAYGSSIDQIGVATRTVYDNALVLSVIAGKDPRDATSCESTSDFISGLDGSIPPKLKIGVIENAFNAQGMEPEVQTLLENVLKHYEKLGAQIVRLSLPTMDYAAAVYFMVSRAEAASNLARFDGVRYGFRDKQAQSLADMYALTRQEGFGAEVKRRILIGNYVLSAGHADEYYQSAKVVQAIMRQEFLDSFKKVDLLFAPVSPTGAFKFGAFADNALAMDLQDYFTAPANLTGLPALALPCGFTQEKLPIGFQLMGPDFSEALIFKAAHAYEQSTPWHMQHPQGFLE
ncbi:MAG: Asp-tRNA(Asn)/Glu-tRNA(Gln) amidotransferase subunit GatA [Candidatus Babeliaceae bacterium]